MLGAGEAEPWWMTVLIGGSFAFVGIVWLLLVKSGRDLMFDERVTKLGGRIFVILGMALVLGGIASR